MTGSQLQLAQFVGSVVTRAFYVVPLGLSSIFIRLRLHLLWVSPAVCRTSFDMSSWAKHWRVCQEICGDKIWCNVRTLDVL
ncbi:hypothetical protein K443DRAFT_672856 [Laccaria amethystina LaAM-08-1]|uniref:Uncharacterized protein n=1 Tax=Laccaria amethystina LaAM-08-1 TaxID=1095629 RepID=A0A0C9X725_9AGAR|nr:hypothetical protein K443DRAFT_672856 [Laccaria amethystina LaAM-08-1]